MKYTTVDELIAYVKCYPFTNVLINYRKYGYKYGTIFEWLYEIPQLHENNVVLKHSVIKSELINELF